MDVKTLFAAQFHIGHPTTRWNPKMKPYIHSVQNGVHVFDLEKTIDAFTQVEKFCKATKLKNGKVLFVGTKPQASFILQQVFSENPKHFFIDAKWAPGLLTNFREIRKRVDEYLRLKKEFETGEINKYTKKEISGFRRELEKLHKAYHGVAEMRKKPDVIIVLDAVVNRLAIEEAQKARCATIALVDSNANPDGIDFVVPGNDDSVKSIRLFVETLVKYLD